MLHLIFQHPRQIPGMCILCPSKKYLCDNWDRDRHYNGVHIGNLIVIENTTALQCKCSDVRSRGWKKDRCTRNAHYHCMVCHWPRDRKSQLANHMVAKHNISSTAVAHLFNKQKGALICFIMPNVAVYYLGSLLVEDSSKDF